MNNLDQLETESIYILREAYRAVDRLAMLWSLGKDSNVMIWLAKKAFLGRVPFPVVHLDTGAEFPETYAFRDRYAGEWGLDLIADDCPPIED
ncbi:MAG: phosphoadenosine phosphosulfate reductase domain-containing protein, partial [Alphaproteobacteria bacterium]